jgi:hypothetical protein
MGLVRTAIVRGPAKIVLGTTTFWTPDDIALDVDTGTEAVNSSMFGHLDDLVINPKITVTFTPHAAVASAAEVTRAALCAILVPAIFTNGYHGTAYLGSGSEVTLQIWASSGELVTIQNAVITKPPAITFSADKPIFGPMTVTGICKTTSSDINLAAVNSVYDIAEAQADPGSAFLGQLSYLQRRHSAAWGALTGFTTIWPEDGFTVDFQPSWRERKIQGLTVDFELTAMEIMVKCTPSGPSMKNVLDMLGIGGDSAASWPQGSKISAQGTPADLTITDPSGPTTVFILKKPVLKGAGFRFGYETLRVGELAWVSQKRLTTGAADALAAWS